MAKAKRQRKARSRLQMSVVQSTVAGIDVGARFHVAAVASHRLEEPVKTFNSLTPDLQKLALWLKSAGVTTVAMESTGVHWIPVYELLEEAGFEVLLVNARDAKTVPGRRSNTCNRH